MENLLLTLIIIVIFVMGYFILKNRDEIKKLKISVKSRTSIISKMSKHLNEDQLRQIYRKVSDNTIKSTTKKHRLIRNPITIDKSPKYNIDDILNEINKVGLEKLSKDKKDFLKNYKNSNNE